MLPLLRVARRRIARSTPVARPSSTDTSISPREAGLAAHRRRRELDATSDQWRTSLATQLSHAGLPSSSDRGDDSPSDFNAPLAPPIELATTYERPPSGDYGEGAIYARSCNPTRKLLEETMGRLEMASLNNKRGAMVPMEAPTYAFSSGMAAVASLLLACSSPVTLLVPKDVYHGVPTQLNACLNDHGVKHESVDMTNCDEVRRAIESNTDSDGTLVVWMETPSNPLCQVTDIQAICNAVNQAKTERAMDRILTVVDSTWAPPCITQPLSLGADAVLHSGTKYLGGHSDVLLGIASCSPLTENGMWLSNRMKAVQTSVGAVASPLECWLTLRGLRTLHLRVERQCRTAMGIAEYLNDHPSVTKCHYPGLKSHPQHAIAARQMLDQSSNQRRPLYGGMLSFELKDEATAMAVAGAVGTIRRATSLGGTETLIEHRASIEPPERTTSPAGLLRVSVGLEDAADLERDLGRALDVAGQVVGI